MSQTLSWEFDSLDGGPVMSCCFWRGKRSHGRADFGLRIPGHITSHCPSGQRDPPSAQCGAGLNLGTEAVFGTPMNGNANNKPEDWSLMGAGHVGSPGQNVWG